MLNISFFSYKGGAGRTSLLYNTLPFLAETLRATAEEPIVVIDLDVDSKGFTYLIDRYCEINSIQVLKGEIPHNPRAPLPIDKHPFFSKMIPIGEDVGLGRNMSNSILFIPAPPMVDNNFLGNTSNADGVNVSLTRFRDICKAYRCKAIVMDTPAGSQLSGDCALSISHKIVTTMRITTQFSLGTKEFLKKISTKELDKNDARFSDKEFIIVPNAVPSTATSGEGQTVYDMDKIMRKIKQDCENGLDRASSNHLNLSFLENGNQGIGEVRSFKFEELNLRKEERYRALSEDELNAMRMYRRLAEELEK